jgi:hypothetical protein
MANVITLVPDDANFYDIALQARDSGQHLIFNGNRFALSSTIPAGWREFPVSADATQTRSAA